MSILIRGMEMPIKCAKCPIADISAEYYFCEKIDWFGKERPSDCPLIELPPYGRLIDVSTVEEIRFHDADGYHTVNGEQLCELEIDAETVIEAEGET